MAERYDHMVGEDFEQSIIREMQKKRNFSHDFDDCGTLKGLPKAFSSALFNLEEMGSLANALSGLKGDYSDAFFSLHLNKKRKTDLSYQINLLDSWLKEKNLFVRKGETTFVSGNHYGVLVLAKGVPCEKEVIGSIDAVVEGRHFRKTQELNHSGFYSCCAALSDIGANGGIPDSVHLVMINPPKDKESFVDGVYLASVFCGCEEFMPVLEGQDSTLGDFSVVFTVTGTVEKGKQYTLRGLEEGMRIYVAGKVGLSSAVDYNIPKEHLMFNLNPDFRKAVFSEIKGKALCSDVSDGFNKSASNFLRYAKGLDVVVSIPSLMRSGENPWGVNVSLDNIRYGGDDYCLVIAAHDDIRLKGVNCVGEVIRGTGAVRYI